MSLILLIGTAAFSALLLMLAAMLMLRETDSDVLLAARMEAARGRWAPPRAPPTLKESGAMRALMGLVSAVGQLVMQSGIVPGRTRTELQQTLTAAGFRGQSAMTVFVGTKLSALFGMPVAGWALGNLLGLSGYMLAPLALGAGVVGLVAPDNVIQRLRKAYLAKIDRGISDALDLMVICAQAGLSLEPGMARVSIELRGVHPEMCLELATTVREMEMMADTTQALANLGKRTGLESLMRLTQTLTQTLQYGTPLSESLRSLSNEMRTAALTRFEEKAARLPVLLTLPMIGFVLPCVFLIVGGPAGINIARSFSAG